MKLQTIGHASLLISDDQDNPILLTDPWLVGSCYWRSWWLQNYPSQDDWQKITAVKYCYITHEHPDHFHTASIRKMGSNTHFLSPSLPEEQIAKYLTDQGRTCSVLNALKWYSLAEDINILSIPLHNDDSCLIIDTPKAVVVNLNDSKPVKKQLSKVLSFVESGECKGKKVIVLNSYSPASIVNSFRKNGKVVSIKEKEAYIRYLHGVMETIGADYFLPFASQAIFYRPDSRWANEYKVSIDDIQAGWQSETQLLRPYSLVDLNDFSIETLDESDYIHRRDVIESKVEAQIQKESEARMEPEDVRNLEKKLNSGRLVFAGLFRKGIGFITAKQRFHYNPVAGKVVELDRHEDKKGVFDIRLPTQALKDAVTYGHFGDLGITMFTIIILNENVNPKLIYVFFKVLTMHDYKHTSGVSNFVNWFSQSLRQWNWSIPSVSTAVPVH